MAALVDLTGGLAERYELKGADPSMYRHLLRAHKSGAFIACSRKVGRTKLSRWFLLSLAFSQSWSLLTLFPYLCSPPVPLSSQSFPPLSNIYLISLCFSLFLFLFLSLSLSLFLSHCFSLYFFLSLTLSLSLSLSLYIYNCVYIFYIHYIL